jgi:putative tryptophan/tyrosine transport system substrate-binding protein
MKRRKFIALIGAVGAWPIASPAQPTKRDKPFRIATLPDFLLPVTRDWFIDAMRGFDWMENRDFVIVGSGYRFGDAQLDEPAARVVAGQPDLILTVGSGPVVALRRVTTTIPIVMLTSGYPVEAGLAESLARPGKNVTGMSAVAGTQLWGKILQLLREAKPDITRVGILWTYGPPLSTQEETEASIAELRNGERLLGLKLHIAQVTHPDQVSAALAKIDAEQPDALIICDSLAIKLRPMVMEFAVKKRLPTITNGAWTVKIKPYHPLLGYGSRFSDLTRNSAYYVDRILKGAKPGDLPIQQPTKFDLAVDLKTAAAIGLTVPQSLIARADEVIE